MAIRYVDSNAGAGLGDGTTWADAYLTLAAVAAVDTAGDTIWVAHNHAESTASAVNLAWAGTVASPIRIMCGNTAAEPPTALATTASVSTTGNSALNVNTAAAFVYWYGIQFHAGVGASGVAEINFSGNGSSNVCEDCVIDSASTGSNFTRLSGGAGVHSEFRNCTYNFAAIGTAFLLASARIIGGSFTGSAVTNIFDNIYNGTSPYMEGCDLSNVAAACDPVSSTNLNYHATFRNCKFPASWSGTPHATTPADNSVVDIFNCDAGDTNYVIQRQGMCGLLVDETTLVLTGGASDGTTTLSWKIVTNTNPEWKHQTFVCPEIVIWNDTTGSSVTATVEILHDSATALQDDEIWMEVQYLGTSGVPLSLFADDAAADYLTTPADQAASSATWTTTGMSNPNTQKLSVAFTPQEKGFVHITVHVAKASYTVYVDPKVTLS